MPDKQVTVWVQQFKDRPQLMLQWTDPDTGKRKSRSAGTSDTEKADKARGDLEYELNHGLYQEASRMSWERFRELFEDEYLSARRLNTRETYGNTLDLFERLCSPRQVKSITERTVSAFAAALRKLPGRNGSPSMAVGTIKIHLQHLRTALRWAADQKLIATSPRFPAVKVPRKTPQPVPAESFERLAAKAPDDQTQAYILCGWLAGLRLGEAFAMEWEQTDAAPWLDMDRDRIVLPAEQVKGAEDQWVPLDPILREALLALPRQGRKVFHFVTKSGRVVSLAAVRDRIIRLARKAGVKLTMKSLRRGFGCRYAGKVPAQVLQKLMRHSDIKITMNYYANVDDAVMAAVLGTRNSLRNSQPAAADEVPAGSSQVLMDERDSADSAS
jgi:integrase